MSELLNALYKFSCARTLSMCEPDVYAFEPKSRVKQSHNETGAAHSNGKVLSFYQMRAASGAQRRRQFHVFS